MATLSSCGNDSGPSETKAELKAELAKLSEFHRDDFLAGDTNNDLRIQDTELTAMIEEDFRTSDLDEDGEISVADIRKEAGEDSAAVLPGHDLDGNGRVPIEEYVDYVERTFMRHMDTNKDGHLDPSEVVDFYGSDQQGGEAR